MSYYTESISESDIDADIRNTTVIVVFTPNSVTSMTEYDNMLWSQHSQYYIMISLTILLAVAIIISVTCLMLCLRRSCLKKDNTAATATMHDHTVEARPEPIYESIGDEVPQRSGQELDTGLVANDAYTVKCSFGLVANDAYAIKCSFSNMVSITVMLKMHAWVIVCKHV